MSELRAADAVRMLARIDTYMPGEAGQAGAERADEEADDSLEGKGRGARRGVVADEDEDGEDDGNDADGTVLAREERFGAFADSVGDDLHLGSSGVAGEHGAGEGEGGDERKHAHADGDPQPDEVIGRNRARSIRSDILEAEQQNCK